jgi:Raf kinase inhibitor-like YbhB/YbcL family protein
MHLWSDAIDKRGAFDPRYTCDIDNSSPEVRWSEPPSGTQSFALLIEAHAPAAAPFAHWVIYRIPSTLQHLPAGIAPQDQLPNGIRQGLNGAGKLGYSGPCPPRGAPPCRYVFRLFALNALPDLPSRLSASELLEQIQPLILDRAEFEGHYERQIQRAG